MAIPPAICWKKIGVRRACNGATVALSWLYRASVMPPLCLRCDSNIWEGKRQRWNGWTREVD